MMHIGVFQLLPRGRAATDHEVVEQGHAKPVLGSAKPVLGSCLFIIHLMSQLKNKQARPRQRFWRNRDQPSARTRPSCGRSSGRHDRIRRRRLHVLSSRFTNTPSAGFVETPALGFLISVTAVNLNILTTAPTARPTSSKPRNLPGQKRGP